MLEGEFSLPVIWLSRRWSASAWLDARTGSVASRSVVPSGSLDRCADWWGSRTPPGLSSGPVTPPCCLVPARAVVPELCRSTVSVRRTATAPRFLSSSVSLYLPLSVSVSLSQCPTAGWTGPPQLHSVRLFPRKQSKFILLPETRISHKWLDRSLFRQSPAGLQ